MMMQSRCSWCGDDPLYVAYHDQEWGVPIRDDRALFEKLILDGFQAGLSWTTIPSRRKASAAFDGFDPSASHATRMNASRRCCRTRESSAIARRSFQVRNATLARSHGRTDRFSERLENTWSMNPS